MISENPVILIEDNSFDAELIMEVLRAKNVIKKVLWLKDGEEALQLLQDGKLLHLKPKLILLDLKLPKVDGIEILKEIKHHPQAKLIPVVVLTSSEHSTDRFASYQTGANSYVVKPINYDEFKSAIEEVGLYWLLRNALHE